MRMRQKSMPRGGEVPAHVEVNAKSGRTLPTTRGKEEARHWDMVVKHRQKFAIVSILTEVVHTVRLAILYSGYK